MYPKLFATKNFNKLKEANEILGGNLQQINTEFLEPQGLDVAWVVEEKARDAFRKTGKSVLVEDTGLEFAAWKGLPGALIKWFVQSVGNKGVLKMLQGETNRKAIAKTAIGFYDGRECYVFLGEIHGMIPCEMRGKGGFGWDPIFIPDNHAKSFAEMTSEEKNSVSMRRLALSRLKEFFDKAG
jgi:non-canonical purine NTP pyrophosphatase (RdgB/HAM1 family)